MNPESEVEIILWDWLMTKGKYIKKIYFNRKNELEAPTFTTTGLNKKPDFVIEINRGYGKEYIAVEIKDNKKSAQVYDAGKILMYYNNYRIGTTKYYINNEEIKISYFVIATQGSVESKLLNETRDTQVDINSLHNGREKQVAFGNEPKYEWNGSSQFLRNLFATFRQYRKDNDLKDIGGSGIGILTSELKEEDGKFVNLNKPHLFIMNYNNYNKQYKSKWGCRFWEI